MDEELSWFIKSELGTNVSSGAHACHMFVEAAIFFCAFPIYSVARSTDLSVFEVNTELWMDAGSYSHFYRFLYMRDGAGRDVTATVSKSTIASASAHA